MSINDCFQTLKVVLGPSICNEGQNKQVKEFYEVIDNLPQATQQANIDVLRTIRDCKARKIKKTTGSDGKVDEKVELEAESVEYSRFCTFEGDIQETKNENEISCVLLYDRVKKELILERLQPSVTLTQSTGMSIKTGGGGKTLAKPPYVVKPSKNIIESDSGLLKRKREKIVADIRKDTNRKNKGIASDNRRASIASNDDMWLGLEAEIEQALNDDDHKGTKNEDVGVDLFGSGNEDSDGEFEDVHMD